MFVDPYVFFIFKTDSWSVYMLLPHIQIQIIVICHRLQLSANFRHMRSLVETGSPLNQVKLAMFSECLFGFHIHYIW